MTPDRPATNGRVVARGLSESATAPLTIRLHRVRLERVGSLRSAHGEIAEREVILVEAVDAEGHVGWGECPALARPGYTAEYLDGCWALLRDVLVGDVLGDPAGALDRLSGFPGHQMARSALIGALVDLDLRAEGRSLAAVLAAGTPTAPRVASTAVIGIHDDLGELETEVHAALQAGHRSVKLKIDPVGGLDAVRAVRRQWPELALAVDANGSFPDADAAVAAVAELDRESGGLGYVEQPLAPDDLVGAAIVARRSPVPVALDESITSLGEAVAAVSLGALGVLNLKPSRVGGPLAAVAIARVMAEEGIGVFCGGMVESGVGRAAALAVAAQDFCTLPADLGPSVRYFRRDVTRPFELVDGALDVPAGPGIGVAPDAELLAAQTVGTWQAP